MRTGKALTLAVAVVAVLVGSPALFAATGYRDVERAVDEKEAKERNRPQITGFRSAAFGMSTAEVVEAMQRDFHLKRTDIVTEENSLEKTSSLVATVADLIPYSGSARVVYIHGYESNKLIQVNILWGASVTESVDPQTLVTTANILRNYFADLGFAPDRTLLNARLDDNTIIVFRVSDEQKRMILLQLISAEMPGKENREETETERRVVALWLSYIENTRDPDIFRIEKGSF